MDLATVKKRLQGHLTDGLVTIVGSGLSVAEGIPGMGDLSAHLMATLPPKVPADSLPIWELISAELKKGVDLESALLAHLPDPALTP